MVQIFEILSEMDKKQSSKLSKADKTFAIDLNSFTSLGKHINKLLTDLYNKDKEILNQRDTIKYLFKMTRFLCKNEDDSYHHVIVDTLIESISRSSIEHIMFTKKQKSKNTLHRGADIEADNAELRKKFKELEAENNQLKDTIFQANRELEKFYEQANDYVKERDEYKRKFKESTDALSTLQGQLTGEKQNYERRLSIQDDTIRKLSKEQGQMKEELNNSRRQSESLSQAQNETIQALQEAIREHDKASEVVRVMPLTSEESWPSSTTSTMSRSAKTLVNSSTDDEDRTKSTRPSGACFDPPCTRPLKITNIPVASDHKLCSPVCPPSCGEFNNNLKKLESEREQERDIHKHEVDNLKKTIQELEKAGIDSIKVVEDAYEQAKLEVSQQRITITNLQEALKVCKNQLDDLHQRSSGDMENFAQLHHKCQLYFDQIKTLNAFIDHLQDSNLELEVKNFEYVQDVALLETRLLKYQYSSRTQCKAMAPSQLSEENLKLKKKIEVLECECGAMKRIVSEAKELHQSFIRMQNTKDDLQLEAEQARKELNREEQLKNINNVRIQELQQRLGEKTCEIGRCDDMLSDLQTKLCWTVCQNNKLKNEISTLLSHVNSYEQNYMENDERNDICQKEIEVCKENLTDLKDKLLLMKGLLQQKVDEYSQLEKEFCVQNDCLACLKEKMYSNKQQYHGEICELRCTVDELQTKLLATETTLNCLREDYQRSQIAVQDYGQLEVQLQDDFANSLNDAQSEILELNNYVSQLTEECGCIKKELKVKEQQLVTAKAQIVHFTMSENAELMAAKEEIQNLRRELDAVLRKHDLLKSKNEALCAQLCEIKETSANNFGRRGETDDNRLKKCVCELQFLRKENNQLRYAYQELSEKYQQVMMSVPILNNEIIEYKSKNENLLIESRNLINNVRAWLDNQAVINQQVTQKYNDDHLIIHKLSQTIEALQKSKCICESRLHAGSVFEESLLSDISLESGENTTATCTAIDNSDDNSEINEPFTKDWLKKVESMTEDLHKSSEYWQSKMSDDYSVTKDT